jgi:hypothetical protein
MGGRVGGRYADRDHVGRQYGGYGGNYAPAYSNDYDPGYAYDGNYGYGNAYDGGNGPGYGGCLPVPIPVIGCW